MNQKYDISGFLSGLEELNLRFNETQIDQFLHYYEILMAWNTKMNLTAITEFHEVIEKHFLDSLCLVGAFPEPDGKKILDLGTGAGFPGIPLKIAFPEAEILLMDSLKKRLMFLDQVIRELELKKIRTAHGRAEEMARKKEYRQNFDFCVSRAVSNLTVLSEYCIPFVKKGGYFVSYKSSEVDCEVREAEKAITVLGGSLECIVKFQLPGSGSGRSLVCIKKDRDTPGTYPRKAGTPARNPII